MACQNSTSGILATWALAAQTQFLPLHMQEGLPERHGLQSESKAAAVSSNSLLPLNEEDTTKARDAVIVAIGISSGLIINVAYIGYITPPGGPDPYWADCFYSVFVAFFVLNGFALVFSVAALCAVTWGPFVLIWCRESTWRTRVVNMGLFHLAVSLAALLGAFACAGFVTASVGAPELTCGNLKCTEGGVPCHTFTWRYPNHVSFDGHTWVSKKYALNPVLAKLNNAIFADLKSKSVPGGGSLGAGGVGQDVTCQSYSAVAKFSDLGNMTGKGCEPWCATPFDGLHGKGVLDDADGKPVNTTCFVLLNTGLLGYESSENPYSFWCSLNGSGLGPGWLPLRYETAAKLFLVADYMKKSQLRVVCLFVDFLVVVL